MMKKTFYEALAGGNEHEFKKLDHALPDHFTFEDFLKTPFMSRAREASVAEAMYHIYCFHRFVGRVYEIKDTIADMLMYTNLDIDTSLFRCPFRQTVFILPEGWLKVRDLDNPKKLMTLTECYVNYEEGSGDSRKMRVMFIGRFGEEEGLIIGRIGLDGHNLKEALDHAITVMPMSDAKGRPVQVTAEHRDRWRAYFQFICNVILYITSADSDVRQSRLSEKEEMSVRIQGLKSTSKIRKLQSRLDRASVLKPYVVGGSVTVSDEERDMYDRLHEEFDYGRHHGYRYPVAGHWRAQWYGSKQAGNLKQRPKWIRTHLRGPEVSEVLRSVGVIK